MIKPFIKVTKDFYQRGDNGLYAFQHMGECHTLFLLLTLAHYTGEKRGTVTTSVPELAGRACVTKPKMEQWLRTLKEKKLITTNRISKTDIIININNFDVYNGKNTYSLYSEAADGHLQTIEDTNETHEGEGQLGCSKSVDILQTSCRHPQNDNDYDNLQAPKNIEYRIKNKEISTEYSSLPLNNLSTSTKEKEKINKKEKENVAAKASTAAPKKNKTRTTSISDVESNLDTEFVAFAKSLGLEGRDVAIEFDKWMDWQDSKGKRFTDNKTAFRNWLRNASKFRSQHTTHYVSIDDSLSKIRRLH